MNLFLFVLIPLVISNVLHMVIVRRNALARWQVPISRRWFGGNKTLRGFIVLPTLNAAAASLLQPLMPELGIAEAAAHGWMIGLVYLLAELPTSFIKRRLGIPPGGRPRRYRLLCTLLDKSDSVIGIVMYGALVYDLSWTLIVPSGMAAVGLHLAVSALLVRTRVKASL